MSKIAWGIFSLVFHSSELSGLAADITTKDVDYTSANDNGLLLSVSQYMNMRWIERSVGHIKQLRVILIHVRMAYTDRKEDSCMRVQLGMGLIRPARRGPHKNMIRTGLVGYSPVSDHLKPASAFGPGSRLQD